MSLTNTTNCSACMLIANIDAFLNEVHVTIMSGYEWIALCLVLFYEFPSGLEFIESSEECSTEWSKRKIPTSNIYSHVKLELVWWRTALQSTRFVTDIYDPQIINV